ncbi:triose-phosphate isomerase [Chitinilyticum piscinae]|uniref:Triosephosphate isomerase n=1 Tax=Chitinilyticum piscinae TaxID=2866724 RepID=A0A8J7FYI6_9NEIS|nr:triose-phosphate isomerase [Chitinilyticum piscinae]MBE9608705.1 triose-phosphate isomerase [Chitinilyticum piscinae]
MNRFSLGSLPTQSSQTAARRKLVVGNWKMHGSLALCREAVPALATAGNAQVEIILCPPAPFLGEVARLAAGTALASGGQDVAELASGARTGEWSAGMLAELGCRYALVGHSERRQHHYENDALIAGKARACASAGITPIVCIGESLHERESGETRQVLCNQLDWLLTTPHWRNAIIAYEPLWAIGSNRPATPELAQETHAFIRAYLASCDPAAAQQLPLLYGGSVNAANAAGILAMPDIDGVLVGGASLQIQAMQAISATACALSEQPARLRLAA